jgi:CRISPR-associated endonuclease Cas3-HD
MNFYAHTLENQPIEKWEPLFSADCPALKGEPCSLCESLAPAHGHLNKVAWWTAKFAAEMFPPGPDRDAARQWGYLAGLWHDLGKFVFAFQRKLKGDRLQIEHAGAGAALAQQRGFPGWEMIAFAIAGHHSGLGNRMSREEVGDHLTPLDDRLPRGAKALEDCKAAAASEIHAITEYPISEDHIIGWKSVLSRDVSPSDLTRQIFSALLGYLRTTADLDLMVPASTRSRWLDLLRDLGWKFFHGAGAAAKTRVSGRPEAPRGGQPDPEQTRERLGGYPPDC